MGFVRGATLRALTMHVPDDALHGMLSPLFGLNECAALDVQPMVIQTCCLHNFLE